MTHAGKTQDSFILPAPPVGGPPISQDRLDRMKLVSDRTIPIKWKEYNWLIKCLKPTLARGNSKAALAAICLYIITSDANMAAYPTKMSLLVN